MKRYETGTEAPYGLYITMRPPDVRFVGAEGESLDGRPGAHYVRLPTWLVLLFTPMLGGAFVLAFPIMILVAIGLALGGSVASAFSKKHAYVARVGWEPAAAYLKKDGAETTAAEARNPELEALSDESRARAEQEKREG